MEISFLSFVLTLTKNVKKINKGQRICSYILSQKFLLKLKTEHTVQFKNSMKTNS